MTLLKLQKHQLTEEPTVNKDLPRYSHPAFMRKLQKGTMLTDYDKAEKLIEIETTEGEKYWTDIKSLFGIVIAEAKQILLLHSNSDTSVLNIVGVEEIKIKRTVFAKLIFEQDHPF